MDCIVCGEICVDLAIRPIPRDRPLASLGTQLVEPVRVGTGGIVPNAGIAMARLGLNVAALGVVGDDHWADCIRRRLAEEGVATEHLIARPGASSVTAVLIDDDGEHTFAFHAGASQSIHKDDCLERLEMFASASWALFGYYNLLPNLQDDLPEVLKAVRETGCRTALDAAYGGGTMQPLDRILPHLDVYFPSFAEARQQTGQNDPQAMIRAYRQRGTEALLGVKLGERGALLSPDANTFIEIPPVPPPAAVVDTTGAGDCFYAGLIAGLARRLPIENAARLAAAAGACSVTGIGAASAIESYKQTWAMVSGDR